MKLILISVIVVLSFMNATYAQRYLGFRPTDSGGPLMPEQAAYDITFYDLSLSIEPEDRRITGSLAAHARLVHPLEWLVLDLDTALTVTSTELISGRKKGSILRFDRHGNKLWIHLGTSRQPGEIVAVRIHYNGRPKEAPAPPWVGGFMWKTTADGSPWIATAVQLDGGDLWWPCKDHPSDEPDSMAITITVPKPLIVASNGKLRRIIDNKDNTWTYHWFVSTPINNYNVALNIGPYKTVEATYKSIGGQVIPVTFWVLPENYEKGTKIFPEFLEHLAFYEKYLGPYPFRGDKYGIAETPHLGMEHQTIIAYGSDYKPGKFGYDFLHHHELGHEWWGNLVTAYDWRDFWIHEGFCSYMQALYTEHLHGTDSYHEYFKDSRARIRNITAVAPRESQSTRERYFVAPTYLTSDGDIYNKGALILHTLRYVIGKEAMLKSLRRFAYPTPEMERITNGRQCRFATTDDYLSLVEEISGMQLGWFFEVYLRQPVLPRLSIKHNEESLHLKWITPDNLPFPMPVEVQIGEKLHRVYIPADGALVPISPASKPVVDPMNWILKVEERL